jgi:hypothetical protein
LASVRNGFSLYFELQLRKTKVVRSPANSPVRASKSKNRKKLERPAFEDLLKDLESADLSKIILLPKDKTHKMRCLFLRWKVGAYLDDKADKNELEPVIKIWKNLTTMSAKTAHQKLVEHHSTM